MNNSPQEYLAFANKLADAAGTTSMEYFRTSLSIDSKSDESPVTIADQNTELTIRSMIEKEYPNHGILGEEFESVNPNAEFICGEILNKWRILTLPIIHIRHSSTNKNSKLHASSKGFEFNDYVKPLKNEMVLTKKVNSAFIGTDLEKILSESKLKTLVIIGMTANHCISSTVRMSGNLGFETYLISDSTACFNSKGLDGETIDCNTIYESAIASLNEEFATILNSKELFEMI